MKYVIGIDLGTSAVKGLLVNQDGEVVQEVSKSYPLIQNAFGHSEQDPEEWVEKTLAALSGLVEVSGVNPEDIEGISFSGQMHGLVLLDEKGQLLRKAILWNDTRTTEQCKAINDRLGNRLVDWTKNIALEGFTLPKLIWVKENEPDIFAQAARFLLPKDYLRFRMTGVLNSEYSDAAGTLMLNVTEKQWSTEICRHFDIPVDLCPPLVESHHCVGTLLPEIASRTGLRDSTKVFAGGADNACGAIGAGILSEGNTLCSIGTSGVILSCEERKDRDFRGKVHFFNHAKENAYYAMGVTLSAGFSLRWFKDTFAGGESFEEFLQGVDRVPVGANGLLFTPYLAGERTPHADSAIRGSFIGMDASHKREDFVRAVMEGITFSLNESIEILRQEGKSISTVVSIGGGAKNPCWLQMQADIFNATVVGLKNEQGPGMGAAMLAAMGCGWFGSLEECAEQFVQPAAEFTPKPENVRKYKELFAIYQSIYEQTKGLNQRLKEFRA
ncbi:xylulokinase [Paenactinomyces guangxiensis]|uniref:Xylulose kinase n=1 Tax=Paenactinomyces guangxiensis TaxID=1490290 RepID=A0A7W2A8M6_9BACL|nr:xylulokinase [Paenactinomyces guangxiensis]MBA4493983.1 xylulokinase [Paenactinomyces guangxiensis]MBH8593404.1 xylulokinase [Paenactinomyces guangxiensis]